MSARKCWLEGKTLKWYYWLAIAIFVVLGISALIPAPGTPTNLVGYSSIDPFAPASTIILLVIAVAIYWFGKKNEKKP